MLPLGHLSAGYLIAQTSKKELTKQELGIVFLSSIILDFDLFLPELFGFPAGTHHYFPIHTLMGGAIIWLLMWVLLRHRVPRRTLVLSAGVMLSHLMLDDLSYWLSLVGLEGKMRPQIFWWYPFDTRYATELEWIINKRISEGMTTAGVLKIYLFTLPRLFYLEIILFLTAIGVGLRKRYRFQKAKKN